MGRACEARAGTAPACSSTRAARRGGLKRHVHDSRPSLEPSRFEIVENDSGFRAEMVIAATHRSACRCVGGSTEPIGQRHMRSAYGLPVWHRLDIEYASGACLAIINRFTPVDDGPIQHVHRLSRDDTDADCPAAMAIGFDPLTTREDRDILDSSDADALPDTHPAASSARWPARPARHAAPQWG